MTAPPEFFDTVLESDPNLQERELKRLNDQLQHLIHKTSAKLYTEEELRQRITQTELRVTASLKQSFKKESEETSAYTQELQAIIDGLRKKLLSSDELNKQIADLNLRLQELADEKNKMEITYASAKHELCVHVSEIDRLKKKLQELQGEADQKFREYQMAFDEQIRIEWEVKLEEERQHNRNLANEMTAKLREEMEYVRHSMNRLQEENHKLKESNSSLEQEKEKLEIEMRGYTAIHQNQVLGFENQLKTISGKYQEIEKKYLREQNSNALLLKQLGDKDAEIIRLTRELQLERDSNEKLKEELLKLQSESEMTSLQKQQILDLQREVDNLRKMLTVEKNNVKKRDHKIELLEREIAELKGTGIGKQVKRFGDLLKIIQDDPTSLQHHVGTKRRRQTDVFEYQYSHKTDTNFETTALSLQVDVHEHYLEIKNLGTRSLDLSGWKWKSFRAQLKQPPGGKKLLDFSFPQSTSLKLGQSIRVWNDEDRKLGPQDFAWTKNAWDANNCKLSLTFLLRNALSSSANGNSSFPTSLSEPISLPEFARKMESHNFETDYDTDQGSGSEACRQM